MTDRTHRLSVGRQARALGISRGSVYSLPRPMSDADLALMRRIDELHLDHPFAGSRMLRGMLKAEGREVGRLHVATLMKRMGIEALYRRPRTSKPEPGHKVYPYLLRNVTVTRPNQVWAMDITYVPMARGFVYLAAVVDWYSRRVLAWRLSITLSADFCIEALEEALNRHVRPEIFNSDQGWQFTSADFIKMLKKAEVAISMDGKGAWRDEHLRRTPLADDQVRGSLPARLPQRLGDAGPDRPLPGLLQRQTPAFIAWRPDARSGICHPAAANPGRGINRADIQSAATTNLSRQAEPLLGSRD
jgi:putative transposase